MRIGGSWRWSVRLAIVGRMDRIGHLFAVGCRRTCILKLRLYLWWLLVLLVQLPFVLLWSAVRVWEVELA